MPRSAKVLAATRPDAATEAPPVKRKRATFGRAWWERVGHVSVEENGQMVTYVDPFGGRSPIVCPVCREGVEAGPDAEGQMGLAVVLGKGRR